METMVCWSADVLMLGTSSTVVIWRGWWPTDMEMGWKKGLEALSISKLPSHRNYLTQITPLDRAHSFTITIGLFLRKNQDPEAHCITQKESPSTIAPNKPH